MTDLSLSMSKEDKPIPPSRAERNEERYDAQRIEQKWTERWKSDPSLYAAEAHSTKPNKPSMMACTPIPAQTR